MGVSQFKHYVVWSSPLRGIEVLSPRTIWSSSTTIMVTAKNASAEKIGNLVALLTQWMACFTASLPTDANPFRGGVGVSFLMFCRSIVVSLNSLDQARFPHMSSPSMCIVFLFFSFFCFLYMIWVLLLVFFSFGSFFFFFSLFPNGFLLCDHGLHLWDRLMCEFNQSINQYNQSRILLFYYLWYHK